MNTEINEKPVYSKEFIRLIERLKNRDTTKQMSDEELHSLRKAINDEMIRREVVKHIQMLANQLK